ncbi:unnamed protein product [Cylindrotheca closterium]|uniref:G-protein coupled receptors family 2 profile 2 domain-containing protein n=1 Tax=Cylindrotheca closterium TaxID=2856 RepID=A0AAD2G5Q2_9STRA|nr:unnamed protein product [Cylindrotheca closterium]
MNDQAIGTMQQAQHEGITIAQDKVLSILPIPSAILSIFGSSVIIYMGVSTRRQRQWTTYTRLLIGLSICDIISSVSLAFAAFLRRPESGRVWAIGTDATCAAIGTMTQFSYANVWYNAALSYYFMATVRFRMKHSRIARLLEPWMHFMSIGFPLVTAIVGALYEMYGEKATGMGCWVNEYPHGCGDEPDQEPCTSGLIGWIFLGFPLLFSGLSILINNLVIGFYVWSQSAPTTTAATTTTTKSLSLSRTMTANTLSSSDGIEGSGHNKKASEEATKIMSKHQLQRLRLVSSQAFLFVGSYVLCNVWVGSLGIVEAITQEEDEPQLMQTMYRIMAINAFFSPLQGFTNMLVYIRPKYLKNREDFPLETKMWTFRRSVFGERVRSAHRSIIREGGKEEEEKRPETIGEPTKGDRIQPGVMKDIESNEESVSVHSLSHRAGRPVSSITISYWDVDQDSCSEGSCSEQLQSQRWADGVNGDATNAMPTARRASLIRGIAPNFPYINESTESPEFNQVVQNRTTDVDDTSHGSEDHHYDNVSHSRWGSSTTSIDDSGVLRTASQNLDGLKRSDSCSSSVLSAPVRRLSGNVDAASMWAASMGFNKEIPCNPNDSLLMIAPKRSPTDHEAAEGEVANDDDDDDGSEVKRSSSRRLKVSPLVAPKRLPSEHEPVEIPDHDEDVVPNPPPARKLSDDSPLVAPKRSPSDCGGMVQISLGKAAAGVQISTTTTTTTNNNNKHGRKNKKRSKSPNITSPKLPRRVPTDYEPPAE